MASKLPKPSPLGTVSALALLAAITSARVSGAFGPPSFNDAAFKFSGGAVQIGVTVHY